VRSEVGMRLVTAFSDKALLRLAAVRFVVTLTGAIPPVVGVSGRGGGRGSRAIEAVGACVLVPAVAIEGAGATNSAAAHTGVGGANLSCSYTSGCRRERVEEHEIDHGAVPLLCAPLARGQTVRLALAIGGRRTPTD
jgi:hypothetical protein